MTNQRVHLYWDKCPAPDPVRAFAGEIERINVGAVARVWSRDEVLHYLRDTFGAAVATVFSCCRMPAMQADFFRYAVLLAEGGAYIDADDRINLPLASWLDPRAQLALPMVRVTDPEQRRINNSFLAGSAGSEVLAFVFGQCLHNVINRYNNNVWAVTGPGVLQPAVRYAPEAAVQLLDPRYAYLQHFLQGDGVSANHWSEKQKTESIFTDSAIPMPSFEVIAEEVARIGRVSGMDTLHHLETGYRYAIIEQALSRDLPWVVPLEQLLALENTFFHFDDLDPSASETPAIQAIRLQEWMKVRTGAALQDFNRDLSTLVDCILAPPKALSVAAQEGAVAPGLYFEAAKMLRNQGEIGPAADAIETAMDTSVYDPRFWRVGAELLYANKCFRRAGELARELKERGDQTPSSLRVLSQILNDEGDAAAALAAARQSLEGGDYVPAVWQSAMQVFSSQGADDDLERTALDALEKDPDSMAAHRHLWKRIEHYLQEEAFERAGHVAQRILDVAPDSPGALRAMSRVYERSGDTARAVEAANRSVSGSNYMPAVWNSAFGVFARHGDAESLEAAARFALEHDTDSVPATHYLARALEQQGELDQAETLAKRLVELKQGPEPQVFLARLQVAQRKWADAQQTIETAARDFPDTDQVTRMARQIAFKRARQA